MLGQHALHGHVSPVGVGHVGLAVSECQFLGLHHHVDALRRVTPHRPQVELLNDVQLLQQDVAAGVGGRLVDRVAVVSRGYGQLPPRPAIGEVLEGQNPALFLAEPDQGSGRLALIERVAPAVDDGLECAGQRRLPQDVPRPHGHPAGSEDRLGVGELAQQPVAGDDARQHVGDREAVLRQVDG